MTRLLRLYPAVWRERYGAEFEALLASGRHRSPTGSTSSAARSTPGFDRRSGDAREVPRPPRGPLGRVVMAIIGGFLFLVAAVFGRSSRVPAGWSIAMRGSPSTAPGSGHCSSPSDRCGSSGPSQSSGPGPTLAFAASLAFALLHRRPLADRRRRHLRLRPAVGPRRPVAAGDRRPGLGSRRHRLAAHAAREHRGRSRLAVRPVRTGLDRPGRPRPRGSTVDPAAGSTRDRGERRHVTRLTELGRFAEPSLYILVSLSGGPKHGYAIMTDVEAMTGDPLGPGTLYGALARLERRGLIEALEPGRAAPAVPHHGPRGDDPASPARRSRRLRPDRPRAPPGHGAMTAGRGAERSADRP